LNELFNRPVPWSKVDFGRYNFSINGKDYTVSIEIGRWKDEMVASIRFDMRLLSRMKKLVADKSGIDILGTGDSVAVFSTIVDIVRNFHTTSGANVTQYEFSALEPSRKKLYDALSIMMLKTLPRNEWFLHKKDMSDMSRVYTFQKVKK
jgi:hypothetical protein